jgi:hypothetical protein
MGDPFGDDALRDFDDQELRSQDRHRSLSIFLLAALCG